MQNDLDTKSLSFLKQRTNQIASNTNWDNFGDY